MDYTIGTLEELERIVAPDPSRYTYEPNTGRNATLLEAIADKIDSVGGDERYDQGIWGRRFDAGDPSRDMHEPCGTIACIAGWTMILHLGNDLAFTSPYQTGRGIWASDIRDYYGPSEDGAIANVAARVLGLDYSEARTLFGGTWCPHDGASPADALRRIAKGESVDYVTYGVEDFSKDEEFCEECGGHCHQDDDD